MVKNQKYDKNDILAIRTMTLFVPMIMLVVSYEEGFIEKSLGFFVALACVFFHEKLIAEAKNK